MGGGSLGLRRAADPGQVAHDVAMRDSVPLSWRFDRAQLLLRHRRLLIERPRDTLFSANPYGLLTPRSSMPQAATTATCVIAGFGSCRSARTNSFALMPITTASATPRPQ